MLYEFCKRIIKRKSYSTKDDFQQRLDVFFVVGRITKEQYQELTALLTSA